MKKWKCKVCGYIHAGNEPPEKCPVCGAPKSVFELLDDQKTASDKGKEPAAPTEKKAGSKSAPLEEWKCLVCGYIHRGDEPPEKCPVCGAPKERFQRQEAKATTTADTREGTSSAAAATAQPVSAQASPRTSKPMSQLVAKTELLTKLHGHPIAVHIPNGVLPVTLFFTFLAAILKSESLAVAAKYNCFFVTVSMPLVLITGFIDWFNRFDGHLTSFFKIKIICGLIVTALTLVLTLWWVTDPLIYLGENPRFYLFLLINLMDFTAAAVAGFYGGKLVFKD